MSATVAAAVATGLEPGDHVVLAPASCGTCTQCLGGHPAYCASFYDLDFGGTRTVGSTWFADGDTPVSSNFFGQSSSRR